MKMKTKQWKAKGYIYRFTPGRSAKKRGDGGWMHI